MRADDAAKLSKKSFEDKVLGVYPKILNEIDNRAREGFYRLTYDVPKYSSLPMIVEKLEGLGYTVVVQNRELLISWGNDA